MSDETSCTCDLLNAICPLHTRETARQLVMKADAEGETRLRDARIILAASRGVFAACMKVGSSLGTCASSYGYGARTLEGDAFETAFEWAREEVRDL